MFNFNKPEFSGFQISENFMSADNFALFCAKHDAEYTEGVHDTVNALDAPVKNSFGESFVFLDDPKCLSR